MRGESGRRRDKADINLVFLLDTMSPVPWMRPNKLPLVKSAMKLLVEQMHSNDRVAVAVYAGEERTRLYPTPAKARIILDASTIYAAAQPANC
ncbi:MAG: hypothetical protein U0892_16635 [Pirellulales bacterium]